MQRRWLALDDQVKAGAVEAHDRELAAHPAMPDPRLHAMMHVIVETSSPRRIRGRRGPRSSG